MVPLEARRTKGTRIAPGLLPGHLVGTERTVPGAGTDDGRRVQAALPAVSREQTVLEFGATARALDHD
jgi:hypothetical protein